MTPTDSKQKPQPPSGILIVDKPQGMTSHDVVSRVRRLVHTRKVGHAGTLDPMATGVLVIGIGKATRLLTYLSASTKIYDATMRLGIGTTSEDADGQVTERPGASDVTVDQVADAARVVRERGWQVPSAVSAIKIGGKRAHALVREGEDVHIPPREVHIGAIDLTGPLRPTAAEAGVPVVDCDIHVECSAGTYVRAIARDIAEQLGTAAHLTALRRLQAGAFTLDDAAPLDRLETLTAEGADVPIIPIGEAVSRLFDTLEISQEEAARFAHGNPPERSGAQLADMNVDQPIGVYCEGRPLGLVKVQNGALRTIRVW